MWIVRPFFPLLSLVFVAGCTLANAGPEGRPAPTAPPPARVGRELRLTGVVEAIHSSKITVPQIIGQGGRLTLTQLISNGSRVKKGDVIAQFDQAQQLEAAF